ncbi:MAG TPA: methylmalonyl-CoA mutase, partial [Chitinophagaceae bacterium]|nr:methylmalonyl-CoA mutase [Chitinophagaceae bacterium]
MSFSTKNKVRIVTAASLFDGHDAAINIMRRILQSKGAEIIHLGHNRSVAEIVECAIEEDVQGIAITSYQGGHVEFFKYMKDLLNENGCGHIKIFGGGGGTILPAEIEELHAYGITRIYSPDDGRKMGLEGMIEDVVKECDFSLNGNGNYTSPMTLGEVKDVRTIARKITNVENGIKIDQDNFNKKIPVLGITGTGGAGKSSVTDEIVRRFLNNYTDKTIAVISVDPSKKKTGGALLGDRIRMNAISSPRAYMRSLATRESDVALSQYVQEAIDICRAAQFDFIILESAGVGQSDASILDYCNISMYVMTPEYGAPSQLEKINMLDYADVICLNKFDKAGAFDALHDIRKQYKRSHALWTAKDEELPVVGTIAAQFNDAGVNELFERLMEKLEEKTGVTFKGHVAHHAHNKDTSNQSTIIPPKRVRYLAEIAETIDSYDKWVNEQAAMARQLYHIDSLSALLSATVKDELEKLKKTLEEKLTTENKKLLDSWQATKERYSKEYYEFKVRDKIIKQPLTYKSLSGTILPKVLLPKYNDWGDILKWQLQENVPGEFPFTAGVFPLKREGEDPTRMLSLIHI